MISLIVGIVWGLAIGIVLALWCFVRYLENLQADLRERITQMEAQIAALKAQRIAIVTEYALMAEDDQRIAALNRRIIDDLFGDDDEDDDEPVTRH